MPNYRCCLENKPRLTPEARAESVVNSCTHADGSTACAKCILAAIKDGASQAFGDGMKSMLADVTWDMNDAARKATQTEREKCCWRICRHCCAGVAVYEDDAGQWQHFFEGDEVPCQAHVLRAMEVAHA